MQQLFRRCTLAPNPDGETDMPQATKAPLRCMQEYMRKLGKCLLALQHDHHGGARPLLDLWVAEAIALICCVRVYNPEFLKVIDSSAMDGSQNSRLSKPLLVQHMVSSALLTHPYRPTCRLSPPVQ